MVNMIKTKINGMFEIILPEHRAVRPEWGSIDGWESERIRTMMFDLNRGDIVFDIGAEEGDITGLLAQKVGNEGGVVMFEPNPKVWPNLRAIWEANKLKTPLGYFVGFASNETNLTPPMLDIDQTEKAGWPVCAYGEVIGNHGFRNTAEETDATPQIKLDDYCKEHNIYPDMITIDVEGAEFEVLKGAEQILLTKKPRVFVSVHAESMYIYFKQYSNDLFSFMKDRGYKYKLLAYDHELHVLFYPAERKVK